LVPVFECQTVTGHLFIGDFLSDPLLFNLECAALLPTCCCIILPGAVFAHVPPTPNVPRINIWSEKESCFHVISFRQAAILPWGVYQSRRQWTGLFVTWCSITLPMKVLLQVPPRNFPQRSKVQPICRDSTCCFPSLAVKLRSFRCATAGKIVVDSLFHRLVPQPFRTLHFAPSPTTVNRASIQREAPWQSCVLAAKNGTGHWTEYSVARRR
jgi:hypothetical protein